MDLEDFTSEDLESLQSLAALSLTSQLTHLSAGHSHR